jgi:outer membrane protein W
MKQLILIGFVCVLGYALQAQQLAKFRAGMEGGTIVYSKNAFGLLWSIEPKYNFRDNMNIGVKVENAWLSRHKSHNVNLVSAFATYDYYYNPKRNLFSPFIGVGAGYYFCEADVWGISSKYNNPTCFARIGFEFWKFRTSLTYNLIRKPSETIRENKNNDYLSLTIGFYLGGGKWKQK